MNFFKAIWTRLLSLGDKSAWILLAIGALAFAGGTNMLLSLISWVAFAFIAAAITIFVSRIGFATIKFSELMPEVKKGNTAAAVVVASVVIYCALAFIGVVMWAK